ncbi:hypothetical protein chiPu_0028113 [Chiloscyllium punctatum]|uniref:NAD(P)(+)--arginine ADP-ribosyltransferase n=1 Tax=Chiloscyllium punctatum TaxID=137246 RepID=A0A401TNQ7_CHIPU|nr:hypothetical protein [Chiloscyllium punctatum]
MRNLLESLPPSVREEHLIVHNVSTDRSNLSTRFNKDIQRFGAIDEYNALFQWKSLHYLLTISVETLRKTSRARTVYQGIPNATFRTSRTQMRFATFPSCSESRERPERFGTRTFFVLNTMYGARIRNYQGVLVLLHKTFQIVTAERAEKGCNLTLQPTGYRRRTASLGWGERCKRLTVELLCWAWLLIGIVTLLGLGLGGVGKR